MLETFETRTQVPGGLGYILDIVVTQINLINPQVEDNTKLKIDAKFLTNNITITTSRINVSEFKGGNGLEFQEKPLKLKDKLFKNPLECQVYYDNQVVGTATFLWPDSIINNIAGDCGRELMHCQEADINNNKQKVGQMEILARLQIKCEEFKPKDILQPKHRSCNPADNVINPNDVLFMVGANKNASVVCADMDMDLITASQSTSSANATCLDLSPFRHINGKTVTNTDILKSIDEANCCRLKQSSNQCKSLMDSVLNQSNRRSQKNILNRESKAEKSTSVSRIISCSSSVTNDSCQCISDVFTSGSKATICQKDNFKENHVKRFCPLCHENVSWVPKFSACPKCGYRSIPFDIEKPYDYKLTAERILQEFINKGKQDEEIHVDKCTMIKEQKSPKSRCTCKDGKICAHCRIKKLCEDIFQTSHNADEKCGKCESNTSELYNICKTSSPDCRPYLMKVFEELRKIYDIKKPKKKDENGNKSKKFATDDENCFKPELNKEMEYKTEKHIANRNQNNEKNLEKEREKFLINNFQKKESCRGEIFDYNSKPKYPGTKIGHKTCLSNFGGRRNVPRNMGWLWNAETKGLRKGWQPGAIRKSIKTLMQYFLNIKHSSRNVHSKENIEHNNDVEEDYTKEPTLHISKKNGDYYITLRPLNYNAISHSNMRPIQFKISKNPLLIEMRKLKAYLKVFGFTKCNCHKPISQCCCRSFLEKKKLEYQCYKECHKRKLPNCCNSLILSDTSDSETEFDFGVTPPAGVAQLDNCSKKKAIKVSTATQYVEDDWKIKEEHAKPLGKYFKLNNCAVGQRFGLAFGPYGSKGYKPGAKAVEGIYGPQGYIPENMMDGKRERTGKRMLKGPAAFLGPDGKFNLAQYLAFKEINKPSPQEIAERKRQKLALLKGGNPPLLCKVDRRGKPIDICGPYIPISCCGTECLHDNRIC